MTSLGELRGTDLPMSKARAKWTLLASSTVHSCGFFHNGANQVREEDEDGFPEKPSPGKSRHRKMV